MIYFDYAASTPTSKEVLDEFVRVSEEYIGNYNSSHRYGKRIKELVSNSIDSIKKSLNINDDYELIFTSGATESNNLAIMGLNDNRRTIITSHLEHPSINSPLTKLQKEGYKVKVVKLNKDGQIDLDDLKKLIDDDTFLITISKVSSETGLIQDLKAIKELIKDKNIYLHSDLSQAIGKIEVEINSLDLFTISAHKIYGIKGIGLLGKRKNIPLKPLMLGGHSISKYRSGTPAEALIASMSLAIEIAIRDLKSNSLKVKELKQYFIETNPNILKINNQIDNVITYDSKMASNDFVELMDKAGFALSKGTACSSGDSTYKVLNVDNANRLVRISISHMTTKEEIDKFNEVFN